MPIVIAVPFSFLSRPQHWNESGHVIVVYALKWASLRFKSRHNRSLPHVPSVHDLWLILFAEWLPVVVARSRWRFYHQERGRKPEGVRIWEQEHDAHGDRTLILTREYRILSLQVLSQMWNVCDGASTQCSEEQNHWSQRKGSPIRNPPYLTI